MPFQTSYGDAAPSLAGMIDTSEEADTTSRTVEDDAGIAFGKPVFRGSADRLVTGTPSDGRFLGWVTADSPRASNPGSPANVVPSRAMATILRSGTISVQTASSVEREGLVYVTPGAEITSVSEGNILAPSWRFDETAASPAVVRIARR